MNKSIINGQMRNKPFLIVIYVSFCTGKSRYECCAHGVNKTPQKFLLFSMVKGGTKTIAHLSIAEGLSF
jgi:hypothetical protein